MLLLGLMVLLAVGCKKEVSFQTSLVLKSWSQESSGDELYPITEVVMYGFAADTTLYTVASYEDALAGVMTLKKSPYTTISAELAGSSCFVEGYGEAQMMPAPDYQSLIVLAVNKQERLYGYTQLALVENLPYLYISVQFQPWKEASSYKNGQWWMFNDFYTPRIGCTVRPKIQRTEGGETEFLTQSRLFAYRVETPEEWLPANWNDAEVGRLTNTSTGAIADPDYSFGADTQGNLAAKLPPEDLLVMVVNAQEECYALRPFSEEEIRAEEEKASEEKGFEVVFPFWNLNPPQTTAEGWLCFYTPSISATVTTTVQKRYNEERKPLTGSILYAYAGISAEEWLPASLEEAANGLLTHSTSGEQLESDYKFSFEGEDSVQFSLPMGEYLLMTVNEDEYCYALRPFSTQESKTVFHLNFPISRTDLPYTNQEGWQIHYLPNHTGSISTYIETEKPSADEGETPENPGNEETPAARESHFPPYAEKEEPTPTGTRILGSVLHAYRVEDHEAWLPNNLADARDGYLTNQTSGERIRPQHTFTANGSGAIIPNLPHGEYLLLVVNYENGCYALRTLPAGQKAITDSILFPVWRSDLPMTDANGWRIYYTPNVKAEIAVTYQLEEGQTPKTLGSNLLYIYRVDDPEKWVPMSLEDALIGQLIHVESRDTATIFYAYEADRDETTLHLDLLQGNYLILVSNHLGCCALHALTADQSRVTLPLNFALWHPESPFTDETGWTIYNWRPQAKPESPETPETTRR